MRVTVGGSYIALSFNALREPFKPQLCSRTAIGSKAINFIFQVINVGSLPPVGIRNVCLQGGC